MWLTGCVSETVLFSELTRRVSETVLFSELTRCLSETLYCSQSAAGTFRWSISIERPADGRPKPATTVTSRKTGTVSHSDLAVSDLSHQGVINQGHITHHSSRCAPKSHNKQTVPPPPQALMVHSLTVFDSDLAVQCLAVMWQYGWTSAVDSGLLWCTLTWSGCSIIVPMTNVKLGIPVLLCCGLEEMHYFPLLMNLSVPHHNSVSGLANSWPWPLPVKFEAFHVVYALPPVRGLGTLTSRCRRQMSPL